MQKLQEFYKSILPQLWPWNPCRMAFFAASHGKSPCDGIWGTVKRHVVSPQNSYIVSVAEMLECCVKNIEGIIFLFVPSENIEQRSGKNSISWK